MTPGFKPFTESFPGLHSPGRSYFTDLLYDSWVQTIYRVITCVVINDLTLSSIQYVEVKLKRSSVRSQRTAMCSKDRSLSGTHGNFTCVDCEAYTVDEDS